MPNSPSRLGLRLLVAGPLAVAVLATLLVVPVVYAGDPAPMTLASGPDGRTLKLGDIAADDDLMAVTFQKKNLSYIRWSQDYGETFSPKVALRSGLKAQEPRVAVCDDLVFAVSLWPTATGRNVGVDYRDVVTGDNGRYSLGAGFMADIACYGEVAAVTWVDNDHAWMAVHELGCTNPCSPSVKIDLGTGNFDSPPRITKDYGGVSVAWLTSGLAIQHFEYDAQNDGSFTMTPGPVLTLMAGKAVSTPVIDSLGQRVVVGYERFGQTHIRVSDNVSTSFGPQITVAKFCRNCPEGGSRPESVSVSGSDILVEVVRAGGVPTAYEMLAFVSRNSGTSWAKGPVHGGGFQRGALLEGAMVAEVWDAHFYNGFPYPNTDQVIRFQVRDL